MREPGADVIGLDRIDLSDVQLFFEEELHQAQSGLVPLHCLVAMVAADMILKVGFNERFDETPFGLYLLARRFRVLGCMGGSPLLFLPLADLSLGIELGALGFGTFLRYS